MSLVQQFGRFLSLTFTDEVPGASVPAKFILGYDGQGSGLRVSFKVLRRLSATADTAEIRIWNLNATSRALLNQRSLAFVRQNPLRMVQINAGYVEQGLSGIIFKGAVVRCWSRRVGPDWITEIEASTVFGTALLNTLNQSWGGAPMPVSSLITLLFNKAGYADVQFGTQAKAVLAALAPLTKFNAERSAYEEVRDLIRSIPGLTFTVDIATVIVLKEGEPRDPNPIIVNETTGMLGTPLLTDLGADFRVLLDPRMRPGALVFVSSVTISSSPYATAGTGPGGIAAPQQVTVWEVECTGDTHEDPWYCDVTSWFFPAVLQISTGQLVTGGYVAQTSVVQ